MNARALICVALVLGAPSFAQRAKGDLAIGDDAPIAADCQPGDVILKPDVAIATAKRLASAEAKVAVYEAHPPLPAWAVVVLVVGGVALGAAATVTIYEVSKPRP